MEKTSLPALHCWPGISESPDIDNRSHGHGQGIQANANVRAATTAFSYIFVSLRRRASSARRAGSGFSLGPGSASLYTPHTRHPSAWARACSYTVRFARLAPICFALCSGGLVSGVLDSTSLLLFTTLLLSSWSPAPSMVPFIGSTPLMRPAALETDCRVASFDLSQQCPASLARVQARQGGLAGGATYDAHASRHARTVCV